MKMRNYYFLWLMVSSIPVSLAYASCKRCTRECHPNKIPLTEQTVKQKSTESTDNNTLKLSIYALSPLTLCQALRETTSVIKTQEDDLAPHNEQQRDFLDKQYLPYIKEHLYRFFSPQELQSYASRNYQVLNTILKNKGFSLQFPQFPKTQIGVLAIQDVLVTWLLEGIKEPLSIGDVSYDGVLIKVDSVPEGVKKGEPNVHFFAQNPSSTVVVKLLTQSNDVVYFVTRRDGDLFAQKPTDAAVAEAIIEYSKKIKTAALPESDRFNSVHFPMVNYDVQPDVSWIEQMRIGTSYIAQAMQQVIFKMNERGARAKAAAGLIVATSFLEENPKERLVIDKPFLVWIERSGVSLPIFAGYMTLSYWSNPGSL